MSGGIRVVVLLVAAMLATVSATAQPAEEQRLEAESRLMFNQSLYYGQMERPRAIAYDARNRELWAADPGTHRISIYRPDGIELYSFTSPEYLRDPARLAIAPNGQVAVLEGERRHVRLFNYRGEYRGELDLKPLGEKPVVGTIAYDGAGQLYIADNRTSQIFVFRADGSLKMQFGSNGSDEGQFIGVCGITVGSDGTIYVLDQRAISVQVFDSEGNFVRGWGKHETGRQNFSLPSGIAVDSKGRVYVSDELRQQVKVFAPDGALLLAFGGIGGGAGQLAFPTDVAVDEKDRIYVSERRTARVQVFELVSVPAH